MSISVVINTLNEEANLPRALQSIKRFADEIIVVDMKSADNTAKIARKFGAKVYLHPKTGYVEPARNFAIAKATLDWILLLDADEELPPTLTITLKQIVEKNPADFIRLPRKNIIFGKWIQHSRWWPDYNIRFFKKGHVTWQNQIHSIPLTRGRGLDLPATQENALIHHHYQTISQYLLRHNNYTDRHLQILRDQDYQFHWPHLITKPADEFFSRYFSGQGYQDGLHGLVLSLLQAFTEFIIYLKAWEKEKFPPADINTSDFRQALQKPTRDLRWWLLTQRINRSRPFLKSLLKLKRKLFFLK